MNEVQGEGKREKGKTDSKRQGTKVTSQIQIVFFFRSLLPLPSCLP
jgi:hypothetical protein